VKFQADAKDLACAKDLIISERGGPVQAAGTVRERVRPKAGAQGAPSSLGGYMYMVQHQQGGECAHQRDQR
jgi:hypothetical protein